MEYRKEIIYPLLEKVEEYGRTSIEVMKLKSLDKMADVMSTLIARLFLVVVLSIFALTLNIAIAFWLGDILGKDYYGFLVVASFYGLAGSILFFIHPLLKTRINNSIIKQMFN